MLPDHRTELLPSIRIILIRGDTEGRARVLDLIGFSDASPDCLLMLIVRRAAQLYKSGNIIRATCVSQGGRLEIFSKIVLDHHIKSIIISHIK